MRERGTMGLFVLLATVLTAAGLLAGCGGDGSETQKGSEELTAPTQKTEIVEETTAPRERTNEETTSPEFAVGQSPRWGRTKTTAARMSTTRPSR